MQQIRTILIQVTAMLIIALIGYIARRTNIIPEKAGNYLSRTVVKITAPALILSAFGSYEFDAQTFSNGMWVWTFAVVFMLFSLFIGLTAGRLMKLSEESTNVLGTHLMAGNVGYLALPIFKAVFSEREVILAAFFVIAYDLIVWTIGFYYLNKHRHKTLTLRGTLKNLVNINIICCTIGLIFALGNFRQYINTSETASLIHNIFNTAFTTVGNCTLPLCMLFTGILLAESPAGSILSILKKPVTMVVCLLKLIVIPLVGLGIMLLLGDFVDPYVRTVVVMELAMPCGAVVVAVAAETKSDAQQATDNMIYSTILCLFTLPLFMVLLNYI